MDFTIRKFTHHDVEDFIHMATSAFADEWLADGMTPEGFARQTRQIFRWKMIPYKLLTALVGIQWEAFVAEVNGRAVAGGMYGGRKKSDGHFQSYGRTGVQKTRHRSSLIGKTPGAAF